MSLVQVESIRSFFNQLNFFFSIFMIYDHNKFDTIIF